MSAYRLVVARSATLSLALSFANAGLPSSAWAAPAASPESSAADPGGESGADAPQSKTEDAKVLAQDGRTLFWNGEYPAAIEAFEAAYQLAPDPNLLFNIATAYEKLGEFESAITYLDRYAPEAPEEEGPAIEAKRRELEEALSDASAAAEGPEEAPSEGPEAVDGMEEPVDEAVAKPPESTQVPVMGALGWSLTGVAAVGAGVGIGFGVSSLANTNEGRDSCVDTGGALRCPDAAQAQLDVARRHAIVADVGFGVAVVAGVAALVVMAVRLRKRRQARDDDVAWQGLGARLKF